MSVSFHRVAHKHSVFHQSDRMPPSRLGREDLGARWAGCSVWEGHYSMSVGDLGHAPHLETMHNRAGLGIPWAYMAGAVVEEIDDPARGNQEYYMSELVTQPNSHGRHDLFLRSLYTCSCWVTSDVGRVEIPIWVRMEALV